MPSRSKLAKALALAVGLMSLVAALSRDAPRSIASDCVPACTSASVGAPLARMLPGDPVILAAGDIASCSWSGDEATATLLDGLAGTVITLGDNVYQNGTGSEFANCYGPSWGRHRARTMPSAGNHDYGTPGASGYYGYFGAAAGNPSQGYYSYDLGAWHIVVVNSNCGAIGGCGAGSPQEVWLRSDLAAHPAACTMAYWHHPRFSSGSTHGDTAAMQPIWQALQDANADFVLNGHEHNYERFMPQTAAGAADPRGIVEFVVGTGGSNHYGMGAPDANSLVRNTDTYGVLKLTLHASSYDWEFVPEAGKTFSDTGTANCQPGGASVDTDGDNCVDVRETGPSNLTGGERDPLSPWDFFVVPTPALVPGNLTGSRNKVISLSDVLAVLVYAGTTAAKPNMANAKGAKYGSDLNGNGVVDGMEYDRSPSATPGQPWRSRAPNGVVSLEDVLVVLAQVGANCT